MVTNCLESATAVSATSGAGLERHTDSDGRFSYIDGWVATACGYVVVYGEPRGPRSKPFVALRVIVNGRCHARSGNTRSDPSTRGLTVLAGRFAREIAATVALGCVPAGGECMLRQR